MSLRAHLRTVVAFVVLALAGGVALPASALAAPVQKDEQADAFGRLIAEKDGAMARQDWPAAERLLLRLREMALTRLSPQSLTLAQISIGLGDAAYGQGRQSEAADHYRQGLEVLRAIDADPFEIEYAASALGNLLGNLAEFVEAESLLREAADIRFTELGPDHVETAIGLRSLSWAVSRTGGYVEAERLARQAIAILDSQAEPQPLLLAQTRVTMAEALYNQGRAVEAETSVRQALTTFAEQGLVEDVDRAGALVTLGGALREQGRYTEAEQTLRESLALYVVLWGPDHVSTGYPLLNLGSVVQYQARLDLPAVLENWTVERASEPRYADAMIRLLEAEALYRRALQVFETSNGRDHPAVASALNAVAAVVQDRGRFPEAETLQRESVDIYRRTLGYRHLDTAFAVSNLANIVRRRSSEEAIILYQDALAVRRAQLIEPSVDIAETLNNLGAVLLRTGQTADARRLLDESFAMKAAIWCPGALRGSSAEAWVADCPGHPGFAATIAGDGVARFAVEDRPWTGLRLMSQAEDMTLRRTRRLYTLDTNARAEFRLYGYVHRQFVTMAWAAGNPADAAPVRAALLDYYWSAELPD